MLVGEDIRNLFHKYLNIRSSLFWLHQKRELSRYRNLFDSIEKQPLTDLQRRSVILDERRNLVVAGAGTGKTSVIVAKAGYLIESGKCKPEDILLLAFNTDAAKELAERCKDRLGAKSRLPRFTPWETRSWARSSPLSRRSHGSRRTGSIFSEFLDTVIAEDAESGHSGLDEDPHVHSGPYQTLQAGKRIPTLAEYVSFAALSNCGRYRAIS